MTPDAIKGIFDGNAMLIMFVWGLIHKYVPFLAKLPNVLIPWINLLGYVLAAFVVPAAHAGALDTVPDAVGVVIGGFTNAAWAMLLYEGWGRGLLEKLLKIKKAVPK